MVWRGRKRGLSEITYHFTGRNSTVWSESSWNHKASAASNAIVKPGLPIVWFYRNKTDVAGNEQSLCNSKTSPIIRNIRCSYWFQWECSLKKLSTCWSTYECYLILYPVSSKCMYVCMYVWQKRIAFSLDIWTCVAAHPVYCCVDNTIKWNPHTEIALTAFTLKFHIFLLVI